MDYLSLSLALCMGIALSAACGLRVFLPVLLLALASRWAGVELADDMQWLYSDTALICLAVATLLELLGYYIPWLDNALDALQAPLSLVAGVMVMGGLLADLPDWLQWGVAVMGGAGAAGVVKTLSSALRLGSTATTGGLGNGLFATLENVLAVVGSLLAFVAPMLALLGLLLMVWLGMRLLCRLRCCESLKS